MNKDLKKLFGQIKNTKLLAVIFIVGIALLMLPGGEKSSESSDKNDPTADFLEYKEELERDLSNILKKIKGAGNVSVMITLEDSGHTYFAKDVSETIKEREDGKEKNTDTSHILKNEKSNGESPLITKKTYPSVSGVLICATGAKNPQIKSNIIKATEALLGIKTHRIEVLERK